MGLVADQTSFTKDQVEEAYPDGIEKNYWNLCRTSLLARKLAGAPEPILDVGCGRGVVVDGLRRQGLDVWGSDTSAGPPFSAAVGPYLFLRTDALALDRARREEFRTLMLLDVLEHLPQPQEFLTRCLEGLPNVRKVLITVPARQELWSNYDEHYGHYLRYDKRTLLELLSQASLHCDDVGYFFHTLYFPARLLSALRRPRATTIVAPSGALALSLHRVAAFGFGLESRLLPKSLPGTSLFAVASVHR